MPVMKRTRADLVSQPQGRIKRRIFFPPAAFQLPEMLDMRIVVCPVEGAKPEGEPLLFNSSLLAASSPVFRNRMKSDALGMDSGFFFRPYEERVLTITHADREHVEMMLKYFQGWDVRFGLDDAAEVWQLGDFYEVPDMCEAAKALWFSALNANNCCEMLTWARTHNIKELVDRCYDLLILRFDDVSTLSGEWFDKLPEDVIGDLAKMDSLVVHSEYALLRKVFGWFMYDPSPRRDALEHILRDLIRHDRLLCESCEPKADDTYSVSINASTKERRIVVLLSRIRSWIVNKAYHIENDGPLDLLGDTYDEKTETLSKEEWITKRAEAQEFAETVENTVRPILHAVPFDADLHLNESIPTFFQSPPRQYWWGRLAIYGAGAPYDPVEGSTISLGGNLVCNIGRSSHLTVTLKNVAISNRHAQVYAKVVWHAEQIFSLKDEATGKTAVYEITGPHCKADRPDSTARLVTYFRDLDSMNGCWLDDVKLPKGAIVPLPYGAKIGLCMPYEDDQNVAPVSNTVTGTPPRMRFLVPYERLGINDKSPGSQSISESDDEDEGEDADEGEGESQEF